MGNAPANAEVTLQLVAARNEKQQGLQGLETLEVRPTTSGTVRCTVNTLC